MDESEPRPPSPSQLSKIPSWISLGFVLGALFVWALPTPEQEAPPAANRDAAPPSPPAARTTPPPLSDIEVVFAVWGHDAVWENDLSEVALWDTETRSFSRFYEVLRNGDRQYFRSIDRLTRPILTHGVREDGPLRFTETEAMRAAWLREKREEDWKMIRETNPLRRTEPRVVPTPTRRDAPRVEAPAPDTYYPQPPRGTTGDGR